MNNDIIEQLYISAIQSSPLNGDKVWVYDFDPFYAEVLTNLVVDRCADLVQDMVDRRIPASEYPLMLKQKFFQTSPWDQ